MKSVTVGTAVRSASCVLAAAPSTKSYIMCILPRASHQASGAETYYPLATGETEAYVTQENNSKADF